jgi:carboxypeptidase T
MKHSIAILFLTQLLILNFCSSAASTHIIKVQTQNREERSRLASLGFALEEFQSDGVLIYGDLNDLEKIKSSGFEAKANKIKDEWFHSQSSDRFNSYAEILDRMHQLEKDHPDLVSLESIGKSYEGQDILAIRISPKDRSEAEAQKIPTVLYTGCHHAREYITVEMPLMFAEYLSSEYANNAQLKALMDEREIYIVPILNVDGYVYDYTNGIRGKLWRKNRSQQGIGTDLNRNYSFHWGEGGSSDNPNDDTFMGSEAFSEPETLSLKNFIISLTRLKSMLDFHSYSELILYPWGFTYEPVGQSLGKKEDQKVFHKMAQQMSAWNHYEASSVADLYIASGNLIDWAYGELGIFAFSFELSPDSSSSVGFYPPASIVSNVFQENLRAMLYILEFGDNPARTLKDNVSDFINHSPSEQGVKLASYKDIKI